jgi:hypothetical protein
VFAFSQENKHQEPGTHRVQPVLKGDDPLMVAQTWLEAATYPDPAEAQAAVAELHQEGLGEQEISVIYTDAEHTVEAGMKSGAIWGGVLGALVGLLFPPAGLLMVAGPILGVFLSGVGLAAAGAVTVAALDGLIAALVYLGIPREIATNLGERVQKGDTLVIVHAPDQERAARVRAILAAHQPRAEADPASQGVVSVPPTA